MRFYLKDIYRRKCAKCDKYATKTLCNQFNEEVNFYCTTHGNDELKEIKRPSTSA